MKQMTEHKLMLKQIGRKFSQHLLMTMGTMSLLVVVTGLSADLPRSPAWTFAQPPLPDDISPRLVQCQHPSSSQSILKSVLNFKGIGLEDCAQMEKFRPEKHGMDNRI